MSILTSSIGKEVNIFKDEYPLPKSSIEVLIPISLNRSNIRFTVETFFTRVLSVISIFNNLGSILFLLIHPNTKSRISSLTKCFADTFAEIVMLLYPSSCNILITLQTSLITHLSISNITSDSSAIGINLSGGTIPSLSFFHLKSASTPLILPSLADTCG